MTDDAAGTVRRLDADEAVALVPALSDVLIDCVEGGASVSFMPPLSREKAERFWRGVAEGVARGERALLMPDGTPCSTTVFYKSLAGKSD